MEECIWLIIVITLSFCAILKGVFNLLTTKLPPGPISIPIITNFQWLRKSFADLEPTVRNLKTKYGPIITLSIGHRKSVFITTSGLAHEALIHNGAVFAARPPEAATLKRFSSNKHNISASDGSLWRQLRRNLSLQILHPSKIKSFSPARKWVLELIKESINTESKSGQNPVLVADHFQFGMFSLLVYMCFGEKLEEKQIREVESVQKSLVYEEQMKKKTVGNHEKVLGLCYVDSLLKLELPNEGGRKLTENELVTLCSEFLTAGAGTTSTALQWIMANLVKYQEIQSKLYDEIRKISDDDEIKEEDLKELPYLRAVILEGLRRHPPGHFVLPHAVTQDVGLDRYIIPKDRFGNLLRRYPIMGNMES
ncbi:hypothetical protein MKX03_007562 [Papaver bracteatum]|nr:hypothetical protein MKX03_007562 [Papaver bracteatum]